MSISFKGFGVLEKDSILLTEDGTINFSINIDREINDGAAPINDYEPLHFNLSRLEERSILSFLEDSRSEKISFNVSQWFGDCELKWGSEGEAKGRFFNLKADTWKECAFSIKTSDCFKLYEAMKGARNPNIRIKDTAVVNVNNDELGKNMRYEKVADFTFKDDGNDLEGKVSARRTKDGFSIVSPIKDEIEINEKDFDVAMNMANSYLAPEGSGFEFSLMDKKSLSPELVDRGAYLSRAYKELDSKVASLDLEHEIAIFSKDNDFDLGENINEMEAARSEMAEMRLEALSLKPKIDLIKLEDRSSDRAVKDYARVEDAGYFDRRIAHCDKRLKQAQESASAANANEYAHEMVDIWQAKRDRYQSRADSLKDEKQLKLYEKEIEVFGEAYDDPSTYVPAGKFLTEEVSDLARLNQGGWFQEAVSESGKDTISQILGFDDWETLLGTAQEMGQLNGDREQFSNHAEEIGTLINIDEIERKNPYKKIEPKVLSNEPGVKKMSNEKDRHFLIEIKSMLGSMEVNEVELHTAPSFKELDLKAIAETRLSESDAEWDDDIQGWREEGGSIVKHPTVVSELTKDEAHTWQTAMSFKKMNRPVLLENEGSFYYVDVKSEEGELMRKVVSEPQQYVDNSYVSEEEVLAFGVSKNGAQNMADGLGKLEGYEVVSVHKGYIEDDALTEKFEHVSYTGEIRSIPSRTTVAFNKGGEWVLNPHVDSILLMDNDKFRLSEIIKDNKKMDGGDLVDDLNGALKEQIGRSKKDQSPQVEQTETKSASR